jgi:hypothetical protein
MTIAGGCSTAGFRHPLAGTSLVKGDRAHPLFVRKRYESYTCLIDLASKSQYYYDNNINKHPISAGKREK